MAYSLVGKLKPQLVFLDIQMPMGSGFSFLEKFGVVPFEVIFVTSYDQYAINAIKFSALGYLLKPVETSGLKFAIQKAIKSIAQKTDMGIRVVNLLNNIQGGEIEPKIAAIHVGDCVRLLDVPKIEYMEGDGRYSQTVSDTNEIF
jgi:two-component system LytT family response regulator